MRWASSIYFSFSFNLYSANKTEYEMKAFCHCQCTTDHLNGHRSRCLPGTQLICIIFNYYQFSFHHAVTAAVTCYMLHILNPFSLLCQSRVVIFSHGINITVTVIIIVIIIAIHSHPIFWTLTPFFTVSLQSMQKVYALCVWLRMADVLRCMYAALADFECIENEMKWQRASCRDDLHLRSFRFSSFLLCCWRVYQIMLIYDWMWTRVGRPSR